MSKRRALVRPLPADAAVRLDAALSHHLVHVLRLRPGATILAFDGAGAQVQAELLSIDDGLAVIRATASPTRAAPSRPAHLVLGRIKPKALDLGIRMAVEAGVTNILLFDAARSQGRPPREERWERIAAAAATQCGRADLPTVSPYPSVGAALDALPESVQLFVGVPGGPRRAPPDREAAIVIGPEGGLTPAELALCESYGAEAVGLTAFTLRAETACAIGAAFVGAPD